VTLRKTTMTGRGFRIAATHDIIVHGIAFDGLWQPGLGTSNDADHPYIDGDAGPQANAWDPESGSSRQSKRVIFDRITVINATDGAPDIWCGVDDVTISRSLIIDSYHPRGNGCDTTAAESSDKARHRITEYGNVYAYNGERQPKLNEGVYDYDFVNNIVAFWQDYGTAIGKGAGGYGSLWDDDGAQERHNVMNNAWLPGSLRADWDCVWGDLPKNDEETSLLADSFHYSGNLFSPQHNANECRSINAGVSGPLARPYTLNMYSQANLEQVLDVAGVTSRTAREAQVVSDVRSALRSRLAGAPAQTQAAAGQTTTPPAQTTAPAPTVVSPVSQPVPIAPAPAPLPTSNSGSADATPTPANPPSCTASFTPSSGAAGGSMTFAWGSVNDADGKIEFSCAGGGLTTSGVLAKSSGNEPYPRPKIGQICAFSVKNAAGVVATCTASFSVTKATSSAGTDAGGMMSQMASMVDGLANLLRTITGILGQ
jgi:hypothetical protein